MDLFCSQFFSILSQLMDQFLYDYVSGVLLEILSLFLQLDKRVQKFFSLDPMVSFVRLDQTKEVFQGEGFFEALFLEVLLDKIELVFG